MCPVTRSRVVSLGCALAAALTACALTGDADEGRTAVAPDAVVEVVDGDRVELYAGASTTIVARHAVGPLHVDVPAGADDVVLVDAIDGDRVVVTGGVPALTLIELASPSGRVELTVHVLPAPDVQPFDARIIADALMIPHGAPRATTQESP